MLPPPRPHFAKALKGIHQLTEKYKQITTAMQNHSSGWRACCCLPPKGCGDVRSSIPKSSSFPLGYGLDQQPQIPMAIEPPRSEKTFQITKSNHEPDLPSPITQPRLPAPRSHTTNSSRDGDSTTSLVSPSQCLATLTMQKFSQYSIQASPGPLLNHPEQPVTDRS